VLVTEHKLSANSARPLSWPLGLVISLLQELVVWAWVWYQIFPVIMSV